MTLRTDQIREEFEREEKEVIEIKEMVRRMKEKVLDKNPSHFSRRDIINASFGSLIIGLAFVFKGAVAKVARNLDVLHIELIILSTFLILIAEIYFVGYSRVKEKTTRHFGEFMTKRLVTIYFVAIISSFFLIYIFNIDKNLPTFFDVMKMVVLLSMPCSVGAAIPSLLKQY